MVVGGGGMGINFLVMKKNGGEKSSWEKKVLLAVFCVLLVCSFDGVVPWKESISGTERGRCVFRRRRRS